MRLNSRLSFIGAFAAVTSIASFGWAAPVLDQHQDIIETIAGAGYFAGDGVNYRAAQQFTPTLDFIDRVDLEATGFAGPTLITLNIYGSAADYGVPETGVLLGSASVTASAAGPLSFDFSALPVDVSGYTEDAGVGRVSLVISADDYFNPYIATAANSTYSGTRGNRYAQQTNPEAWAGPYGSHLYFQQYGHDAVAVPEPTSLAALGIGAVTLLGRRRARRA